MECEAAERGPGYHFWEVDGPGTVSCECGAEGRIVVTPVSDLTRVYVEGGAVAHFLDWHDSPNDSAAEALCGRSAWPGYWHGTGTQGEYERASSLRLCVGCMNALSNRTGGLRER